MFLNRKKHKKSRFKAVFMLSLALSAPVLTTVESVFNPQVVYADPENANENNGTNSGNNNNNSNNRENNNSNNGGSSNSSSQSNGDNSNNSSNAGTSDSPTSENNDTLKTGVSADGKGNELFKNLDMAKNDLYNENFPTGVRSALLAGALKYNEGMQLLTTYEILKDNYGGTKYHDLMNGTNNDKTAQDVKSPASGIKIDVPKSFGNQDMLNMLTADNQASSAVEKDKATQIETGDSGQDTKNNPKDKNNLADPKLLKDLEPLAEVMAQNFLNACALRAKHPATYTAGSDGALAVMPIDVSSEDLYSNNGGGKPSQQLVEAFEGAIAKNLSTSSESTSDMKGKTDKETAQNIKNTLDGMTLTTLANGRDSNILGALGHENFPKGDEVFSANGKNVGNYGITDSLPQKIFGGGLNGSAEWAGYPIEKTSDKGHFKLTFTDKDYKHEDASAVKQTKYLTPANHPETGFKGNNTDKWLSNYKRLMSQQNKDNKDAESAIKKITSGSDLKDLTNNVNADEKAKQATEKATKGLQMLGWDYIMPKLSDNNQQRQNISGANWKISSDGKFTTAGEGNDGKGLVAQTRFFLPTIGGDLGNNSVFKLYNIGSVGFTFGQNQSLKESSSTEPDSMIGFSNANSGILDGIKGALTGKLKLNKISNSDMDNGSGADKGFNQSPAFKMQRYISGNGSLGSFSGSNGTDAVGFDNYGDLIDGGTSKVIVPYWQNGLIPQFSSFTGKNSAYMANPILNSGSAISKSDGMKGVFGKGETALVKKVSKTQLENIVSSGSPAYKNAVAVQNAITGSVTDASSYVKAVNKAVGSSSSSGLSDKACQSLAILITAGTSNNVQAWNQQFLQLCGQEKHLYIGNSLTDTKNKNNSSQKSKYSNLFTVSDITQYIGLFFQRGGALVLRKTIVGLISQTYNSTFAQNQAQNVFYTPTFNFMQMFYSMPTVVAFGMAILMILIVVVTYLEYAFLGAFGKSKIFTRLFLFLMIVPYFAVFHSVEMSLLNTAQYKMMNKSLKEEAVLDQYANVREETALNNVFYSALFGDRFEQINKSTSYAIPFYTTTKVNGQVDGTNGKDADQATKNMTDPEKVQYMQSAFIHAENNNGNGRLPFGTQYRYKKVYVASSDLLSWAINMTRQTLSADGKIKNGDPLYETPSNGFKPGQEPLFTWLAKDYKPLGTSVPSNGKTETQNKALVTNALFGYGSAGEVIGEGGGDPSLPSIKPNAEKIYRRALADGATKEGAAAMVGNADQESSCNPSIDAPSGFGIFQWTDSGNRRAQAKAFAGNDVEKQVDYAFKEMNTNPAYKPSLDAIKGHDISKATSVFCSNFERAGDPRGGTRLQYAQQALKTFSGDSASTAGDTNGGNNNNNNSNSNSNNSNVESYNPKDFWEKLNPAEGTMKSAYGKFGTGASNGTENNNGDMYKDFDHYTEFMVQTNHKAKPRDVQLGIDNSTTSGGWLSASQLFLRIWQTTFTDNNDINGSGDADKFNALKNFAVAMNGYQNIPTGNSATGYQGGNGETAKQFTQTDRNELIDNLSETQDIRQKLYGQDYSPIATEMMGLFNIPHPTDDNDWLNLSGQNSPLNMVLTYYGRYSGRSSRQWDIQKINEDFLNSYLDTYSLVRASLDPQGKDSTNGSTENYNKYSNTYTEDTFSMAEAQIMAIEEWFDINKVAGIKVFPTNYAPQSVSLDTFNRILFEPIGEIGKELTDNSTYNYTDYNTPSPIRMQDNVIEFLSVRNNVFTLFVVLIMNYLLLAFGMVMMLLVKYMLPIVSLLAFLRIFFAPNDNFKFKNLFIGSVGLVSILAFFKVILAGALAYMSIRMNEEYALAGTYVENHTFLNAFVIILVVLWFFKFIFKDWFAMVKQNGILSLGAGDSGFKEHFKRLGGSVGRNIPIIPKVVEALGAVKLAQLPGKIIRSTGRGLVNGMRKGYSKFAPKVKALVARKRANIQNRLSESQMNDRIKRRLRNSSIAQRVAGAKNAFLDLYHEESGNGVKGFIHRITNATIGAVGASIHGVKPEVLKNALKGSVVQTPTKLGTLDYGLKGLTDENYQKLKNKLKKINPEVSFNDVNRVVHLPADRNSMRSVIGRSEMLGALSSALTDLNKQNYKVPKASHVNRLNLGEDVLNDARMELGNVSKYKAKRIMNRLNDILTREDGKFGDYINGDSRVDGKGNRTIYLRHLKNLTPAQRQKIGAEIEKDSLLQKYLTPDEHSSRYDRRLSLDGTGIELTDDTINKLANRGIRYMNGALFYNSNNARQNDVIDSIIKKASENAKHDDLNALGTQIANYVANPNKAFKNHEMEFRTNPNNLYQMQYKVGDIERTGKDLEALHQIGRVNARMFNKAVQEESKLDETLNQAFVHNGKTNVWEKTQAYKKAIENLNFAEKPKMLAQLDNIENNIDKINGARSVKRVNNVFANINNALNAKGMKGVLYDNLSDYVARTTGDTNFTKQLAKTEETRNEILDNAGLNRKDRFNFSGMMPSELRELSTTASKLKHIKPYHDTNTMAVQFERHENSNLNFDKRDAKRLSRIFRKS